LGTYVPNGSGSNAFIQESATYEYFAGVKRWQNRGQQAVTVDRLGSVVRQGTTNYSFFPYGEPNTGSGTEYATYRRDATGLDYAVNRYYGNQWGRFMSPDPYLASGGPKNPGSWNRYSYVQGDPVNFGDPRGLDSISAGQIGFCLGSTDAGLSDTTQAMCAMILGPRPSAGDLYNSSGQGIGMGATSGGSLISTASSDLASGYSSYSSGQQIQFFETNFQRFAQDHPDSDLVAAALSMAATLGIQIQVIQSNISYQDQTGAIVTIAGDPVIRINGVDVGTVSKNTAFSGSGFVPIPIPGFGGVVGFQPNAYIVPSTGSVCFAPGVAVGIASGVSLGSLSTTSDIARVLGGFSISGSTVWADNRGVQFVAGASGSAYGYVSGTIGGAVGISYGWCYTP
jgi:RHS repeat-associated protein